jgi:hypothetical protein
MKTLLDSITMVIGAIWAMCTEEQIRQYQYDNGEGEVL